MTTDRWRKTDANSRFCQSFLSNVRDNLRPATNSQNLANAKKRRRPDGRASSLHKGVAWYRAKSRWHAQIRYENRRYHLGYFAVEAEAAWAYNAGARILFGPFARPNRIPADQAPPPARRVAIERDVERRLVRAGRAA